MALAFHTTPDYWLAVEDDRVIATALDLVNEERATEA